MKFKSYLIEYKPNTQNLNEQLKDMKKLMDSEKIPDANEECESCNYLLSGSSILDLNND